MLVPNRFESVEDYRYGFNGKEKDDEVKGKGAQYDYGFRIYDPRLGKFLSTDPLFGNYPWYTPYQFAGNKPIWAIDLDGLEELIVTKYLSSDGSVKTSKLKRSDYKYSEWLAIKKSMYIAFSNSPDWVEGKESYTLGGNNRNWYGPDQGTLMFDATGNTTSVSFDPKSAGIGNSKTATLKESLASGAHAIDVFFFNPDPLVEGSEKFKETFWAYTEAVALGPVAEYTIGKLAYVVYASRSEKGVNLVLKFKKGWSEKQKAEAVKKAKSLTDAETFVVKNPTRKAGLRNRYEKAGGKLDDNQDADHIIELQLGGADELNNVQGLDSSVNRSFGSQIKNAIKDLPEGTKVDKIIIID